MGAVNYRTSKYITLGLKPYDYDDFAKDPDLVEEAKELGVSDLDRYIYDQISEYYAADAANVQNELDKYDFRWFKITIEYGYYEGFSLNIEPIYDGTDCLSWGERREAQKEITQVKQCLAECAGMGLVQCFPGWCTGYCSHADTLRGINEAVREMRKDVREMPSWAQYKKENGIRTWRW